MVSKITSQAPKLRQKKIKTVKKMVKNNTRLIVESVKNIITSEEDQAAVNEYLIFEIYVWKNNCLEKNELALLTEKAGWLSTGHCGKCVDKLLITKFSTKKLSTCGNAVDKIDSFPQFYTQPNLLHL